MTALANLHSADEEKTGGVPSSADAAQSDPCMPQKGPGAIRAVLLITGLAVGIWVLASLTDTGEDETVVRLGRLEVTARLVDRPERFPELGAYKYTYVLKYEVLKIHRHDPEGNYRVAPGDEIFVGHYRPSLPRSQIKDAVWGDDPLGGKLTGFVTGEVHRMALDYELEDISPSGVIDYCYPIGVNRFFALWTNRTDL